MVYILSAYSQFLDGVGLSLHNMRSIVARF